MSNSSRIFHIAVCLVTFGLPFRTTAAQTPILPIGFDEDTLVTTGLDSPVTLAFLPDGRIVIGERASGRLVIYARGALGTIGIVPDVFVGAESGLLSVAVDPGWPAQPHLWVYYTHVSGSVRENRVERFTLAGDLVSPDSTDLGIIASRVILDGIDASADTHNGGSLRFGADGSLFLSIGDGGTPCSAQDLNSLHGKILRLDVSSLPSGSGPPPLAALIPASGNPYSGPTDEARLVYASGLRNPFRFHVDHVTGLLYIADVGASDWEEVNECAGGENFGWPLFEGPAPYSICSGPAPILSSPIAQGSHSLAGFVTFLTFAGRYRNPPNGALSFGPNYDGDLFISDLRFPSPLLRAVEVNGTWQVAPTVPGQNLPGVWGAVSFPIDSAIGPDGAVYYVDFMNDRLARIKSTTNALTLTAMSPTSQKGNAGTPAFAMPTVLVSDAAGMPRANETVHFAVTVGGGTINVADVMTNSLGIARAEYLVPEVFEGVDPVITAYHATGNVVTFDIEWRGLALDTVTTPSGTNFTFRIQHSEPFSGVTLAAEFLPVPSPFLSLTAGSVWTSIVSPMPQAIVIGDGVGLTGGMNQNFRTDGQGQFTLSYFGIPPVFGLSLYAQAYALDHAEAYPALVMISNRVELNLP